MTPEALRWNGELLNILDQRLLPDQVIYHPYDNATDIAEAIRTMQVRGAPAIGIAAAYAVYLSARTHWSKSGRYWLSAVEEDIRQLADTRPTAVNLSWALGEMQRVLRSEQDNPLPALVEQALVIHRQDIEHNRQMGQLGAAFLAPGTNVLTHCNAGALATGGYGTALGVIRSAWSLGMGKVYATETRPWLQGTRLTVWELQQDNIPVTLLADSAAAYLMRQGRVDWVIVGADRIALNGDVANKIGTYSLAVLARQHKVNVMVVAPTSTIDGKIQNGNNIPIEQRESNELLGSAYETGEGCVDAWNPVFDITPAEFITVIVTEKGVIKDPSEQGIRSLMK